MLNDRVLIKSLIVALRSGGVSSILYCIEVD